MTTAISRRSLLAWSAPVLALAVAAPAAGASPRRVLTASDAFTVTGNTASSRPTGFTFTTGATPLPAGTQIHFETFNNAAQIGNPAKVVQATGRTVTTSPAGLAVIKLTSGGWTAVLFTSAIPANSTATVTFGGTAWSTDRGLDVHISLPASANELGHVSIRGVLTTTRY